MGWRAQVSDVAIEAKSFSHGNIRVLEKMDINRDC